MNGVRWRANLLTHRPLPVSAGSSFHLRGTEINSSDPR
jgi:hypothetical protein